MKPNRPRANAFHLWSPRKTEEGTPTPVPSPSPKTPTLGELVKHMQPLIYDSDDECCSSTPKKRSAFFPNIGVEVRTPVFNHEDEELRLKRPQLFRVKTKRDESPVILEDHGKLDHGHLDLTPKKHAHFRESYPEKFEKTARYEIDFKSINEEYEAIKPIKLEEYTEEISLKKFLREVHLSDEIKDKKI